MVKERQVVELLSSNDFIGVNQFYIADCYIDTIDLIGVFELKTNFRIENCVIRNLRIHSCWFVSGFSMKNSVILNEIDYQMGGHNNFPILLEGNIFKGFVNFFDCQFHNIIELRNNVFVYGTNLLGNKDEGFANIFEKGWINENNIGKIDLNGVG